MTISGTLDGATIKMLGETKAKREKARAAEKKAATQ